MSKEPDIEDIPPLPEAFIPERIPEKKDEPCVCEPMLEEDEEKTPLPPLPERADEAEAPLPAPPADEQEEEYHLPPVDDDLCEEEVLPPPPPQVPEKHTLSILSTVVLIGITVYNCIGIVQSKQEAADIDAQMQENSKAIVQAEEAEAANQAHLKQIARYGPSAKALLKEIEMLDNAIQKTKSGLENISEPVDESEEVKLYRKEEARLLEKQQQLTEKKQQLLAKKQEISAKPKKTKSR